MDLLIQILKQLWQIFMNTSIPIAYQGVIYNISLYALFLFTGITGIVILLIAKALD